jgi:hypothetical protein
MKNSTNSASESRALPVAAHTPGPWHVDESLVCGGFAVRASAIPSYSRNQAERAYYQTLTVSTQRDAHPIHGGGITEKQALANARLIAAGPELLSLAILCNAYLDPIADQLALCHESPHEAKAVRQLLAQARAAIAKAKGL